MIYLDHHATTPCDPSVVEAMLPWLTEKFGNPHSQSHAFGRTAAEAVEQGIEMLAGDLDVSADSLIITSGATESNLLAIRGVCMHPRQKRRHLITSVTEHPAVLDVVDELEREGFRVTRIRVDSAGFVDLDELTAAVDDDTALVSMMWANNEIGTISPLRQIADICHARGALLHTDAAQAVGRLDVAVPDADVDLVSASAHKFYAPKGIGLLVAGNSQRRVRLKPQQVGGGQQQRLRGGTMNPAGIVAMATALRICRQQHDQDTMQIAGLRNRLAERLMDGIEGLKINGPELNSAQRLAGNLSCTLPSIEGEAWMSATADVAFSSGSACSSAEPTPSHVLTAIGLSESAARRSVRFGVGRFNTVEEIERAADQLIASYHRLAGLVRPSG